MIKPAEDVAGTRPVSVGVRDIGLTNRERTEGIATSVNRSRSSMSIVIRDVRRLLMNFYSVLLDLLRQDKILLIRNKLTLKILDIVLFLL